MSSLSLDTVNQLAALGMLEWFDGEFSRLIEMAFRGRIILTQQEASARFRKTSRWEITEDE